MSVFERWESSVDGVAVLSIRVQILCAWSHYIDFNILWLLVNCSWCGTLPSKIGVVLLGSSIMNILFVEASSLFYVIFMHSQN